MKDIVIEGGGNKAIIRKMEVGYNVYGYHKGTINVGWYAPTLKGAKSLAAAIVYTN